MVNTLKNKPKNTTSLTHLENKSGDNVSFVQILLKLRNYIALIVIVIFFSILSPGFLSMENIIIMSKHVAINAFLAIGATFVIITGGIDLSVGAIVGICGMIAGGLIHEGLVLPMFGVAIYFHILVVLLITILFGTLIGAINGAIITKFKVAPFICTLGTMFIVRGFALLRSGGETFPNLVGKPELGNTGFPLLGAGTIVGIPLSVWLMIVMVIITIYFSKKTPLGRHIYAVGGNERAATLSGVQVNKVKVFVYMLSGFMSAIVGLIIASQLVAAHPANGDTFEMNAIAAAVLGGTSLSGGKGTIGGTIIGAFVIGVLGDGLVMLGVSSFWQLVIKGIVIITAVVIDQIQGKFQSKTLLPKKA